MIQRPRKRFGQHFLVNQHIIQKIVAAIRPLASEYIIEIGPGRGALTSPLLKLHPNLMAIEIDRDLVQYLTKKEPSLTIFEQDVLSFDFSSLPSPLRIIGNLPYNISTPLLFYLLTFKPNIQDMIFMLQKEVVDRMCADVHTKSYGRLSVMLQAEFEIEKLFNVPQQAFSPSPKVDSAIVWLTPRKRDWPNLRIKASFEKIVRECFSHRRKTLRSILNMLKYDVCSIERFCDGIDFSRRPENLSGADYQKLAEAILLGEK